MGVRIRHRGVYRVRRKARLLSPALPCGPTSPGCSHPPHPALMACIPSAHTCSDPRPGPQASSLTSPPAARPVPTEARHMCVKWLRSQVGSWTGDEGTEATACGWFLCVTLSVPACRRPGGRGWSFGFQEACAPRGGVTAPLAHRSSRPWLLATVSTSNHYPSLCGPTRPTRNSQDLVVLPLASPAPRAVFSGGPCGEPAFQGRGVGTRGQAGISAQSPGPEASWELAQWLWP